MMRLPKIDHAAPSTLSEAFSFISEQGEKARLLSGGTDLLVASKLRNVKLSLLVSLGGISELKGIRFDEKEGLRIGAMATLNDLRYHPDVVKHYPALSEAAASVGTTQLQHMGTLGGNLCLDTRCMFYNQSEPWRKSRAVCFKMGGDVCHVIPKGKKCYAVYSGDMAPALITYDARVKLVDSTGERTIDLKALYTGDGKIPNHVKAGEILSDVMIPPPTEKQRSTYLKYRVRGSIDFPLAGVAVRVDLTDDGICQDCRIVLNAVSSGPVLVIEAENVLKGKELKGDLINQAADEATKTAHPVANALGATPSYRRKMIGILTRRALLALIN
jgi:4-hydroxybenzoyl-CoA reductase subunit beta